MEVCLDRDDAVWCLLHSGSRGIGNAIAQVFIDIAKAECNEKLEDPDTARLTGKSFEKYIEMMEWAQRYAFANRELMMEAMIDDMTRFLGTFELMETINCHHNFASKERHFGREMWITRKGAIRADVGDMGIIPGSMGAATYIVEGKGCADSYNSSAHGAGRMYSRSRARKTFSVESLREPHGGQGVEREERGKAAGRASGRLQAHRAGNGGPGRSGIDAHGAEAGGELQGDVIGYSSRKTAYTLPN